MSIIFGNGKESPIVKSFNLRKSITIVFVFRMRQFSLERLVEMPSIDSCIVRGTNNVIVQHLCNLTIHFLFMFL